MSNDALAQAVATLDDLSRRLSVPGATCTASELAAVADSLRLLGSGPTSEIPTPGAQPQVVEAVAALAQQVATLEAEVAPASEHGESVPPAA